MVGLEMVRTLMAWTRAWARDRLGERGEEGSYTLETMIVAAALAVAAIVVVGILVSKIRGHAAQIQ
jgi:hypothetical protein